MTNSQHNSQQHNTGVKSGSKLKECPFCGGEAQIFVIDEVAAVDYYTVECKQCNMFEFGEERFGASNWGRPLFRGYSSEQEAIKAWNNRYKKTCWDTGLIADHFTCSECGRTPGKGVTNIKYCPNCGAKVIS